MSHDRRFEMFTLKRKLAALAISATLLGGGAGALAPVASAGEKGKGKIHINNVRLCNNRCVIVVEDN
jgi:hypothetical protein